MEPISALRRQVRRLFIEASLSQSSGLGILLRFFGLDDGSSRGGERVGAGTDLGLLHVLAFKSSPSSRPSLPDAPEFPNYSPS